MIEASEFFDYFHVLPIKLHCEKDLYRLPQDVNIYPNINDTRNKEKLLQCITDSGLYVTFKPPTQQGSPVVITTNENDCSYSLHISGETLWDALYNFCKFCEECTESIDTDCNCCITKDLEWRIGVEEWLY